MPSLRDIHAAHASYQDASVQAFEAHLRALVMQAQGRVIAKLQEDLSITDGVIDQTPGNIRTVRNLNNLFVSELNDAGFPQLLEAFVKQFPGQLPYLQQILDYLEDQSRVEIPVLDNPIDWTGKDRQVFASMQANAVSSLETAVEISAGLTMQKALFSVGGLKFKDLVESLTEKFEGSIGQARTMADTAMSTFYRTATDRAFQKIEDGQDQQKPIKYRYSGPEDRLVRRFCQHLLDVDRSYTREQIDRMNNGQLPNVMLTGGGFNCRHQFLIDTSSLEEKVKAA